MSVQFPEWSQQTVHLLHRLPLSSSSISTLPRCSALPFRPFRVFSSSSLFSLNDVSNVLNVSDIAALLSPTVHIRLCLTVCSCVKSSPPNFSSPFTQCTVLMILKTETVRQTCCLCWAICTTVIQILQTHSSILNLACSVHSFSSSFQCLPSFCCATHCVCRQTQLNEPSSKQTLVEIERPTKTTGQAFLFVFCLSANQLPLTVVQCQSECTSTCLHTVILWQTTTIATTTPPLRFLTNCCAAAAVW